MSGLEIADLTFPGNVEAYTRFEISFAVRGQYSNPFDPEEIDVYAEFVTPLGNVSIPAFYYQNYTRKLYGGKEILVPLGDPLWKVRFTPTVAGEYKFRIIARSGSGQVETGDQSFVVLPPRRGRGGFVRIGGDGRHFVTEGGRGLFLIGHNVCWYGEKGTFDYDRWFDKMASSGENYARIWMAPWAFGIEWEKLGFYDLEEAWRLDYVLQLAEERGIYVVLCLVNHGQFSTKVNPMWSENPYNSARGGPLSRPEDFFTDKRAKELFKRRLRYIVARWAYSTSILAWELWNEVDLTDNYDSVAVAEWHEEMARYIRELDPYDHLITTSFSDPRLDDAIWRMDEIDFTQIHIYGARDMAGSLPSLVRSRLDRYGKPVLVSEYAADWRWFGEPLYLKDVEGVEIHNGLWSVALSGSAGTPMMWWWDNYIDPYGLYYHYNALSRFLSNVDLAGGNFTYVEAEFLGENLSKVILQPSVGWSRPPHNVIVIGEGVVGEENVPRFLQGGAHPELRNNPIIRAEFYQGGKIRIRINSVSRGGARIVVRVDGVTLYNNAFPDRDGKNDADAGEYAEDVVVEVGRGVHTVSIDNTGHDWASIDYIVLEGVKTGIPAVRLFGLQNSTMMLLWAQNRIYTWFNVAVLGEEPEPINGSIIVRGVEPGAYRVAVWDTYRGVEGGSLISSVGADGLLKISILGLKRDVAYRIVRIEGG